MSDDSLDLDDLDAALDGLSESAPDTGEPPADVAAGGDDDAA